MTVAEQLVQAVCRAMPADSEVKIVEGRGEGIHIATSWLLNDDTTRPNKRSVTIVTAVTREAVDALDQLDDPGAVGSALEKLEGFLHGRLDGFSPGHTSPPDAPRPEVTWVVPSSVFR